MTRCAGAFSIQYVPGASPPVKETLYVSTVPIGTVIDEDMSNSIRVTVVATGLGREAQRQVEQPAIRVVRAAAGAAAAPAEPLQPNYGVYDRPAVQRRMAVGDALTGGTAEANFELLDVPAFLRRQAD